MFKRLVVLAVGSTIIFEFHPNDTPRDVYLDFWLIKKCRIKSIGQVNINTLYSHHLLIKMHFMENIITENRRRYYVITHMYQLQTHAHTHTHNSEILKFLRKRISFTINFQFVSLKMQTLNLEIEFLINMKRFISLKDQWKWAQKGSNALAQCTVVW